MKERSKLFRQLGGIKKTQRGMVARRALKRLDKFEMAEFEKKMVKFETKSVPIKEYGKVIGYL